MGSGLNSTSSTKFDSANVDDADNEDFKLAIGLAILCGSTTAHQLLCLMCKNRG
ncbi:MAG: hypothetical protein ACI915_004280 [Gammaproteobacteria bacterium]|jgi:hypothetical protein